MSKNNALILKDCSNINADWLYESNDWDLVEFDFRVSQEGLTDWYLHMRETFPECVFAFDTQKQKLNIEKSKELVSTGKCGVYCGPIEGMTLAWPIERYEALPPPTQCNPDLYPEVNVDTYIDDAKIMSKYKFGYFSTLVNGLGDDAVRQAIVVHHYPKMKILQHLDSKDPLKLHIPVISHKDAIFCFGDEAEREWYMEPGKVYLLNTGTMHGTYNPSGDRVHIITRVKRHYLPKLLLKKGNI